MTFLNDQHRRELLEASVIDAEVMAERGYRTITRPSNTNQEPRLEMERLGIPRWATKEDRFFPGLLMPMYRATGERISAQFKPSVAPKDPKTGKGRKYASVKGQGNRLDVHPRNTARVADPTVPLWITEGLKKADSLTSRGACVVALTGVFNWRSQLGTLGDWEDVPLKGREVYVCFDADARSNMNVLRAMVRLGRWLGSKGAKKVWYLIVPAEVNGTKVKGADDYFAAGGTIDTLTAHASHTAPNTETADDTFSDARMAETIAEDVMDGAFCWSAGLGWMGWDGTRWSGVSDKTVTEAVRVYVIDRFQTVLAGVRNNPDGGQAGNSNAIDGWRGMLSAGRMKTMVNLAAGIVEKRPEDFDAYPDLLNTPTGVVDLETGELMGHDPDLYLTKVTDVGYVPGAQHKDWDAALEAIPAECREWTQLRYGQAITGHMTPDDVLLVQQGGGENGKTTVTGAVGSVLGGYYVLVSDRVILADPTAHPTELMELRGARFALIEETPEARRLSVSRLKKTVGTPQITARLIAKDSVTFDASHTLVLSTNYTPVVEETDHGTWRRLLLLKFPYTFRKAHEPLEHELDKRGDPGLRDRCKNDQAVREATLAWLVAGAVAWYQAGKQMPEPPTKVVQDTQAWRGESDVVLAYLEERLEFDPNSHVLCAELLRDFNEYLKAAGHREWSDKVFSSRFGGHDHIARHRVEKKLTRRKDGLSRPGPVGFVPAPVGNNVPANYKAWLGVRFAASTQSRDPWDPMAA